MSSTESFVNAYELLGTTEEVTDAEIKTAYRQRSRKVHPDRVRFCAYPSVRCSLTFLTA
jgi:DnaJ family protein C protein 17